VVEADFRRSAPNARPDAQRLTDELFRAGREEEQRQREERDHVEPAEQADHEYGHAKREHAKGEAEHELFAAPQAPAREPGDEPKTQRQAARRPKQHHDPIERVAEEKPILDRVEAVQMCGEADRRRGEH
jgi:hypothetical protein